MPRWSLFIPLAAAGVLLAAMLIPTGPVLAVICAAALVGAVISAVHHAEVIAYYTGEPFGTLVLAVAITVIEVALIVSMMLSGASAKPELPRDTVYSAIMIICNGVVGLCLLVGGMRHHEQAFRIEGASSPLACLIALATLSLVLPAFTTSAPGLMHPYRNLPSPAWRRSCYGRSSCSCRRYAIATTSCPLALPSRMACMRLRHRSGWRGGALCFCL